MVLKKIVLFACLYLSLFSFAQEGGPNYVIDYLTTKQGLSHNYVTSLVSDDLNIKWIGTENGITKFDGYNFDYIKPNEQYKGILNENIEVLFMDKNSNLWIGTKSGGLSYFDIKNNSIKNLNYLIDTENKGGLRITAISQDNIGNMWIGTWKNGVFVIDFTNNKLVEHFKHFSPIFSIKKDFKNNIWYSANNRIFQYNILDKKLTRYQFESQVSDFLSDHSRNKIWISSVGKEDTKLYYFNYNTKSIQHIETGVKSNFSKKLSLDKYNHIWIGTWKNGVYRSNLEVTSFTKINLVSKISNKISGNYNTVLNIHHDKNNVTWLSTAGGGVVKLLEGNGFKNAYENIENETLKEYLNCTSIFKNKEEFFLGTISNGLYKGTSFKNLKQVKALGNIKINTLYQHNNNLYVGTSEGYYIYDLLKKSIIFSSTKIRKVTTFLVENDELFLGTQQNGLAIVKLNEINNLDSYRFYSEEYSSERKIESNRVTSIKKDDDHQVWVSTYNGLHLYNKKRKEFIHQSKLIEEKLPIVIINAMDFNYDAIWLATPNGLIKLVYKNNRLKIDEKIAQKDGLNSDFICALNFDNQSNLWFSTHTEIVKYNLTKKQLVSYGDINGIKSTSFNNNSIFNFQNEEVFFGGIDNVTFFKPNEIREYTNSPEIIFTNLRVNNKIIAYDSTSTILNKNFNYADKIKLRHNEDFFSTRFVANDFLGNLNIKYRYKLEGYQNDWIDLQNRNEINFAGLSPGNYVLKVEASRDNQNWSEPKAITIDLLGSPYKSPLAILIYLVLFFLILIYLIRSNNYKLKLKNNLEIAKIDKQKEMELTEAKLNFFTNISHEFRTPLTLIMSPLKELIEKENLPPKVYKSLNYIDRNTNRLLNLINQLLDFRKADHGLLKLNVSEGNFVRFSSEVHLYFKEAAKAKKITYSFKAKDTEINFPFDRNKMEIVLCNVLSNALKYTSEGDKIKMTVSSDKNFCKITIKDTGIGMKSENLDKIFDRFFQIKTANTARMIGSGIGLSFSKKIVELHHGSITAKSKVNEGTEFVIKLAMDSNLYEGMIDETFMKSDNIKGYLKNSISIEQESLSIENKKYTVLIIDDNPEILGYLKDILSEDYHIISAENGNVGYEKATAEIPDLIISDVMMPGKDGITLCKELKTQIATSHIPIILLTARTSTVFEIEGLKTGANDYVTKPFNTSVIKARVESLLENREKLRAHLVNKVRFEPTNTEDQSNDDVENSFINKAIVLVEENLDNTEFGIHTLVESLHMSRSSLFRKIKSLTGLSLSAFIRSIRLKRAAYLILVSELNLSQIAFEVGFNDYKYFKTSFKKQFKCLPSKYKDIQSQRVDK